MSFLYNDLIKVLVILPEIGELAYPHRQCHGCWWPGVTRSQGISNHDIYYIEQTKFNPSTFRVSWCNFQSTYVTYQLIVSTHYIVYVYFFWKVTCREMYMIWLIECIDSAKQSDAVTFGYISTNIHYMCPDDAVAQISRSTRAGAQELPQFCTISSYNILSIMPKTGTVFLQDARSSDHEGPSA